MQFRNFVGGFYTGQLPNSECEDCINLYAEPIESGNGKNAAVLYRRPGYREFAQPVLDSACYWWQPDTSWGVVTICANENAVYALAKKTTTWSLFELNPKNLDVMRSLEFDSSLTMFRVNPTGSMLIAENYLYILGVYALGPNKSTLIRVNLVNMNVTIKNDFVDNGGTDEPSSLVYSASNNCLCWIHEGSKKVIRLSLDDFSSVLYANFPPVALWAGTGSAIIGDYLYISRGQKVASPAGLSIFYIGSDSLSYSSAYGIYDTHNLTNVSGIFGDGESRVFFNYTDTYGDFGPAFNEYMGAYDDNLGDHYWSAGYAPNSFYGVGSYDGTWIRRAGLNDFGKINPSNLSEIATTNPKPCGCDLVYAPIKSGSYLYTHGTRVGGGGAPWVFKLLLDDAHLPFTP